MIYKKIAIRANPKSFHPKENTFFLFFLFSFYHTYMRRWISIEFIVVINSQYK